jgi:hypothetical protein
MVKNRSSEVLLTLMRSPLAPPFRWTHQKEQQKVQGFIAKKKPDTHQRRTSNREKKSFIVSDRGSAKLTEFFFRVVQSPAARQLVTVYVTLAVLTFATLSNAYCSSSRCARSVGRSDLCSHRGTLGIGKFISTLEATEASI